jgi:hypothetical protein
VKCSLIIWLRASRISGWSSPSKTFGRGFGTGTAAGIGKVISSTI